MVINRVRVLGGRPHTYTNFSGNTPPPRALTAFRAFQVGMKKRHVLQFRATDSFNPCMLHDKASILECPIKTYIILVNSLL